MGSLAEPVFGASGELLAAVVLPVGVRRGGGVGAPPLVRACVGAALACGVGMGLELGVAVSCPSSSSLSEMTMVSLVLHTLV